MAWKIYKLGEVLKRRKETVKILPSDRYKLVTIKLYHKGVILRSIVNGSEIKSAMSVVREGDFVLSGIDARNGAFGIVPKELDGAVVTNDFWSLDPDEKVIDKEFLLFLTSTQFFDYICKQSSDGTTQRIRLQREKFFDHEIELPLPSEQKDLVRKLNALKTDGDALSSELTHQLSLVKQLRQAFLREAMQGKLAPQDPNDEPASELLKKIKAEKEQLIKEKKIKKEKELPPIKPEEIPFEIPKSWLWCRLGEIAYVASGSTPKQDAFVKTGVPYLKMYNLKNQRIEFDYKPQYIKREIHEGQLKRSRAYPGDVIMNIVGPPLGKLAIVPKSLPECNFNQAGVLMRGYEFSINPWFYWYLSELSEINSIVTKGVAGQDNISVTQTNNMRVPLPPILEQQRIVGKLEQLMNYCDDLERSIKQSQTQNKQLLQQVLREALQPKMEYEMNNNVSLAAEP